MNTLVFYNEKGSISIENVIINALKNEKYDCLNIIFTDNLKNIELKDFILVIGKTIKQSCIKHLDKSAHIIVDSCNKKCIRALANCKARIYTCGFSDKDYITFSSREDSKAVVSLQRDIKLNSQKVCEPFEIPCEIKKAYSDYSILASVLTLILLQLIDDKKLATIKL